MHSVTQYVKDFNLLSLFNIVHIHKYVVFRIEGNINVNKIPNTLTNMHKPNVNTYNFILYLSYTYTSNYKYY